MFKRRRYIVLILFLALTLTGCATPGIKSIRNPEPDTLFRKAGFEPAGEVTDEYVLGPADIIEIRVWGYEDLKQTIAIPPNGVPTIYPIGKLKAASLTPTELQEKITEKLFKFVKEIPSVTVTVLEYNYYRIYVLGAVRKPGLYPFKGRMTALEAVALAGNYADNAVLKSVQVVRVDKDDPTVAKVITINLARVIHRGDVSQDIKLRTNDIVFVPSSFMSGINKVINDFLPSIQTVFYVKSIADDM